MFEEFTAITIPASAKVVNDEHQDMGQDYGKVLELHLDNNAQADLLHFVTGSPFYKPINISDNIVKPDLFQQVGQRRGLWYRNKRGYAFYGSTIDSRDNVTATIDTIASKTYFQYLAD